MASLGLSVHPPCEASPDLHHSAGSLGRGSPSAATLPCPPAAGDAGTGPGMASCGLTVAAHASTSCISMAGLSQAEAAQLHLGVVLT